MNLLFLLVLKRLADFIKDGTVKEINTTGDQVGDERFGLLNIVQDLIRIRFCDQTSKVVGGFSWYFGAQNGAQSTMSRMCLPHLDQRECTGYISMKDEDLIRAATQDLVTKVIETSCCAERLIFAEVTELGS